MMKQLFKLKSFTKMILTKNNKNVYQVISLKFDIGTIQILYLSKKII